ncbi:putative Endonuclease/exonuclease/phosphatase superfamily [Helianthus debilis subsp. tardiflorus]
MNFLSINIRGIGVYGKSDWVRSLRVKNGVDFVAIQESKLSNNGSFDIERVWGRGEVKAERVGSSGRSGGLISLWKPKVFKKFCHWQSVIDTIQSRLSSWKAHTLSMGGRLTLIKSVLASLPIYYLSLYKAPSKVVELIEKLMRAFLWGGTSGERKLNWVAWDTVTTTKKEGGLGIAKVKDVNVALLSKWAWRFYKERDSLWRKVIEAIHGGKGCWVFLPSKANLIGCWKSLVSVLTRTKIQGKSLHSFIRGKVGDGSDIRFWFDNWLGSTILKDRWPALYRLERHKGCTVIERLQPSNSKVLLSSSWSSGIHTVEQISEMQDADFFAAKCHFFG